MNKSKFLVLMSILLIFGFTSCNKNGEKVTIKTNQPEIVNAHHAKITGTIKSLDKSINEKKPILTCHKWSLAFMQRTMTILKYHYRDRLSIRLLVWSKKQNTISGLLLFSMKIRLFLERILVLQPLLNKLS